MRLPRRNSRRARAVTLTAAVLAVLAAPGLPASAQDPTPPVAPAPAEPAAPPVEDLSWTVDLNPGANDTGVRLLDGTLQIDPGTATRGASLQSPHRRGMLMSGEKTLQAPAQRSAAELVADLPPGSEVLVDVRGLRADGRWTEWLPAAAGTPADFGEPVRTMQARMMLMAGDAGASPVVRSLQLIPDATPVAAPAPRLDLPLPDLGLGPSQGRANDTFRVFATREGLVGGTTANGHVIRPRDHFAALPSRRGLAPRGTGDYTVKVCADNGRCEWAPVWDVGPWNTTDDHWNPSDIRQSWRDLAKGLPQAQAAFLNGYNGGLDQFGRRVANPAGIDLGDGTFWDGLRLRDNSWVNVSYQWTFAGPTATVRAPAVLNVRRTPDTSAPPVGAAADRARVVVECTVGGQMVTGSTGTSNLWLRLGPNQFVSAAWVNLGPGTRPC